MCLTKKHDRQLPTWADEKLEITLRDQQLDEKTWMKM